MAPAELRKRVVADWLTRIQGELTQDALARDISAATGWNLDRTRLGRYQNGRLAVGREVIAHLADYAKARGIAGPEFAPPVEELPPDPVAAAIDRQTAVLAAVLQELRDMRAFQVGQADGMTDLLADIAAALRGAPVGAGNGT